MNINPFKLFDPSYLFDWRPGSEFMYLWPLIILFLATFTASFWVSRRGRADLKSLAARMREFSALGFALTFFRDQNIPYLGARTWLVLLFASALAYGIWIWKDSEKKADLKPMKDQYKETIEKYLPKKKKH